MENNSTVNEGRTDDLFDQSIRDFNGRNIPLEFMVKESTLLSSEEKIPPLCYEVDEIDLMAV